MNLFTYGSLMFPAVWNRVTDQPLTGKAAGLQGYSARQLRGESYPVLVPDPSSQTTGILYSGVSPAAMQRLDQFEGCAYQRVQVTVVLPDGSAENAWVYRAADPAHPDILEEPWDAGWFAREGLVTFLTDDPGFAGPRDSAGQNNK